MAHLEWNRRFERDRAQQMAGYPIPPAGYYGDQPVQQYYMDAQYPGGVTTVTRISKRTLPAGGKSRGDAPVPGASPMREKKPDMPPAPPPRGPPEAAVVAAPVAVMATDAPAIYRERYPSEDSTMTLFPERSLVIILVIIFIFVVIVVIISVTGTGVRPSRWTPHSDHPGGYGNETLFPDGGTRPMPPSFEPIPTAPPTRYPPATVSISKVPQPTQTGYIPPDTGTVTFTKGTGTMVTHTFTGSDVYICTTDYCADQGNKIVQNLSKTVQPCDDFYAFVCDNFIESLQVREDIAERKSMDTMMFHKIEAMVFKHITDVKDPSVQTLFTFFDMCRRAPADGILNTVKELFKQVGMDNWPYSQGQQAPDPFMVSAKTTAMLRMHPLFRFTIEPDPAMRHSVIAALDEPDLMVPREFVVENTAAPFYTAVLQEALTAFQAQAVETQIAMFEVEMTKALAPLDSTSEGTAQYKRVSVGEAPAHVKTIVSTALGSETAVPAVILKSPTFITSRLYDLVSRLSPTSALNYIGFHIIVHLSPHLPDSLMKTRSFFYYHKTTIYEQDVPRWKTCLHSIDELFPMYLLYINYDYIESIKWKEVIARLTTDKVNRVFIEWISKAKWMGDFTQYIAARKVASQLARNFYPVWISIKQRFQQHISSLPAVGDNTVMAYQKLASHIHNDLAKAIQSKSFKFHEWPGSVFDQDASFDIIRQTLFVPMGTYDVVWPTNSSVFVLHSARYGTRITRAMTQMLMEKNYYYDSSGVVPEMVWSGQSQPAYEQIRSCIVDQYNNQPRPEHLPANPPLKSIQDEIVTYVASIEPAFAAFEQLMHLYRIYQHDYRLINAEHISGRQLYFIYYAMDHCAKENLKYNSKLMYSTHIPLTKAKVNVALMNSVAFQNAWKCPAGSKMNPARKCIFWTM